MLLTRNIIFFYVLCLTCFLNQASSFTLNLPTGNIKAEDDSIREIIDWKCKTDSNCAINGSICNSDRCQCTPGYMFNTHLTSCIKVATAYGESCEESIQCSRYLLSGGSCIDNHCVCVQGYYYMHGRCNAYSELFQKCRENDDCYVNANFEAVTCDNGICKCNSGFYQREYRTCRPAAKVGEDCIINNDCNFNDTAICNDDSKCVLSDEKPAKVTNIIFETCPRKYASDTEIRLGDNCTVDTDCEVLGNAVCGPFEKCTCARAHFPSSTNDKCVPELGEACRANDTVIIDYSICRNGRWNCEYKKVISRNNQKCEKVTRKFKSSCLLNEQCNIFGPDALCQNRKCTCNEKSRFIESENFCWTIKKVGETCENVNDCFVEGMISKLECTNKVCSCPEGTHLNVNETECIQSSAEIGMECEINRDCITENAICKKSVCACSDYYYLLNGKCVRGINSDCTKAKDCVPQHSTCASNICTCNKNYTAASISSCILVKSYGQVCEQDIQCSAVLPNSICKDENSPKLMTSYDSTKKTCHCVAGYHYKADRCYKKKVLGESCVNRRECYLNSNEERAVCRNEKCACDWGYTRANDTICKATSNSESSFKSAASQVVSSTILPIMFLILKLSI